MNVSILTLFPGLYEPFIHTSLIGRAQQKGLMNCDITSLFSFAMPKERIDAPTFGPGSGMVIRADIVQKGILDKQQAYGPALKIFFSPQGKKLDQVLLQQIYQQACATKHLMLVASRYEGMDSRVEGYYADHVLSVGDFVLMGGDLPAMVFLEGLLRYMPDVVGKSESVQQDSFTGPFVDYPQYAAPVVWNGLEVPEIIRSGNHAAIAKWRRQQAVHKTVFHHFAWLRTHVTDPADRASAAAVMPAHYVALLHGEIMLKDGTMGTTSVTSLDIHDIARSAMTYGIKNYFVVTPLFDQQKIVRRLLDFWQVGIGAEYNIHRHQAVNQVQLAADLDGVIDQITQAHGGVKPIVIATSAQGTDNDKMISYFDQEKVWAHGRPILLIFGTGSGIHPERMAKVDYILMPVCGFSSFNHLSVRSAVAIILDRWLGINLAK